MNISPLELLKVATKMEDMGYNFYLELTAKTKSAELKKLFTKLSNDEKEHQITFKKIISTYTDLESDKQNYVDSAEVDAYLITLLQADIFKEIARQKELLNALYNEEKAIQLGIEAEKQSITLYNKLKELFIEPETHSILDNIISEEQKHQKTLENLK